MSQPRIFVSHSHQDNESVRRLVHDLEDVGARVWVDLQEIQYDSFIQRINEGLAQSDWCIVVLSPHALASQYVIDEVNAAYHLVREKKMQAVIPFVIKPVNPNAIPALWKPLHRYDATTQGYTTAFSQLCSAIGINITGKPISPSYSTNSATVSTATQSSLPRRSTPPIPMEKLTTYQPAARENPLGCIISGIVGILVVISIVIGVMRLGLFGPDKRILWSYATGGAIDVSVTVSGGAAYASSEDHSVYAIDAATGKKKWQHSIPSRNYPTQPKVDNGVVFVTDTCSVYALDSATGNLKWSKRIDDNQFDTTYSDCALQPLALDNGIVYFGWDFGVGAMKESNGAILWQVKSSPGLDFEVGPLLIVENTLYVESFSGQTFLYAINKTNGDFVWKRYLNSNISDNQHSSVAYLNGMLFALNDEEIYGVKSADGTIVWSRNDFPPLTRAPVVGNSMVYLQDIDGHVYALNPTTGKTLWNQQIGGYANSSPFLQNNTLFVKSSGANGICALDATTGKILWSDGNVSDDSASSPTVVNATLYVGSSDKKIYALSAK